MKMRASKVWIDYYRDSYGMIGTQLRTNLYLGHVVARSASCGSLTRHARTTCRKENVRGYTDIRGRFICVEGGRDEVFVANS